jgi:hypothetical protein
VSLNHDDHQVRLRDAKVPMRGHRLNYQRFDVATEILCDFYSAVAVSEFKVFTTETSRVRINMGGGWITIGNSQATAGDLGAFTAGQTRAGTVEVTIPSGSGSRHEELPLMIDLGV